MMSSKLPALLGTTMLALAATAQAADMPQLPPPEKLAVTEFFSPWYVRIDGGYRMSEFSGATQFGAPLIESRTEDNFTIGGGFGVKWNWFRTDITFDYGAQKFEGFLFGGQPTVAATMSSYTTLWNAYIDFGTWYGFTPYAGLGVGFSWLKANNFTTVPATLIGVEKTGHWDFSWAGIVGAGYSLSPGFMLDLNYRYLDLGRTNTNVPGVGTVVYGDWTTHEFRLGLRYLIQ